METPNKSISLSLSRSRLWLAGGGLAILLIAVFFAGRTTQTGERAEGAAHDATAGAEADAGNGGETIYYCPMHPEQTSTDPDATCPICGMDLVAGDTDDEDDRDLPVLRLSERAMALMNIEVSPVERRTIEAPLHFLGRLEADETRLRDVAVRSSSYVEELYANHQWQMVSEGEPLAELYSPEVRAAARELLIDQRRTPREEGRAAEDAGSRLRRLGVSADQIEEILETGEVPATYQVRSPIDGHIMDLSGREGHWVDEGDRLLQVMDPSRLWVQLEAYERDLAWLRRDLPVNLTVEAFPGETFEGEVSFIDPHLDPRTRTVRARVEAPNPEHRLKPGMFVRGAVQMQIGEEPPDMFDPAGVIAGTPEETARPAQAPLVIPASAPLITGRTAVVYVKDPSGDRPAFEGRRVTLGRRAGDYYLVREGLEEGELVVTNGAFKIDSELQIRGRPSMMSPDAFPERAPEPEPVEIPADHPAYEVTPGQAPDTFVREIAAMYGHYLDLIEALADDDFDAARAALEAYHDRLIEVDKDALDEEAQPAWEAVFEELQDPFLAMYEAEDLQGLRLRLERLSEYTALMVQGFGANEIGPLYRLNCPMAFDDRGADWFQDHREVTNPYFGEEMFRCGSVTETLIPSGEEQEDGEPAEGAADVEAAREAVPEAFAEQVAEALQHYFRLSDALAADDFEKAREGIVAYHNYLLEMDRDLLEPEDREAWQELDRRLHESLHTMAEVEELDELRSYIAPLTEAMEEAALAFGGDKARPLYQMHCPMALDDEGAYWLQPEQELNNPYMGEASGMLACGTLAGEL